MKKVYYIAVVAGILCTVLSGSVAQAARVTNLYQATVPVSDRTAASRQAAMAGAFKMVLIKVSGNANVASVPDVSTHLSQAKTLLQQYRYLAPVLTPVGMSGLQLQVQFDADGVNQLLQQTGQALWPNNRPRIGVWLSVVGPDNEPHIITDDLPTQSPLAALPFLIKREADQRGLPIALPTQAMLAATGTPTDINQLSANYLSSLLADWPVDGLLTGRLSQTSNHLWQSDWVFTLGQEPIQWHHVETDLEATLVQAIADVTDNLTQQFAVLPDSHASQTNRIVLHVDQVSDASTFSHLMHYLRQLSFVWQVQVLSVRPHSITVALEASGGRQALQQALQFGHFLVPASDNDTESDHALQTDTIIRYQVAE